MKLFKITPEYTLLTIAFLITVLFVPTTSHAFTLTSSSNNAGLNAGLVGWWTFDGKDVVNGRALDKSGSGNHGSLTNISTSTFYTTGKIGQGFRFDGGDDYMIKSSFNYGGATSANEGSASFWVNLKSRNDANFAGFLTSTDLAPLIYQSSGTLSCRVNNTLGSGTVQLGFASTLNKWDHYVCVWNLTGGYLYKNGVLVSSDTSVVTPYETVEGNSVYIGSDRGVANRYTNADIDDVRIYNRALSATEVTQLYNQGAATKQGVAQKVTATSTCSTGLSCGLVGYWSFDGKDVVNGRALDKSGSGNHGTLTNISTSTFYTMGKIGQAFKFDGTNDTVNIATNMFANRTEFSLMVWTKKTKGTTGSVFSSSNGGPYWRFTSATTILHYIEKSDCTGGSSMGVTYPDDGKFHYIGFTVSTAGLVRFYVDGVVVNSYTYPSWNYACADATDWRSIGSYAVSNYFNGLLDDVRIYNRALSATEVTQLYNQGAATKQGVAQKVTATSTCSTGLSCGLVGYWSFDGKDVVNGRALDKSGSGNHGTLTNISTSTFYTTGKIGQGFRFDGTNDYVNCGSSASVLRDIFTFSVWAKMYDTNTATPSAFLGLGSNTYPVFYRNASSNRVLLQMAASNYRYWSGTSPTNIVDNKWHHYVLIVTGNTASDINNSILYIDGRVQDVGITVAVDTPSSKTLCKLGLMHTSGTFPFKGTMDDVRMYDRTLSAAEVMQLYNQGKK